MINSVVSIKSDVVIKLQQAWCAMYRLLDLCISEVHVNKF